jgi:cytosine-specific methyltransferase
LIFSSLDHYLQEKEKGFKQGDINNQSYLFWEYIRILNQIRPKFFLLENVVMTKENQKIITDNLFGIEPVMIDSKLLS